MALNFGKYKNSSLEDVLLFDRQYVRWCLSNVSNFSRIIDKEDLEFLQKLLHPLQYIEDKYKVIIENLSFEDLANYLYKMGIIEDCYQTRNIDSWDDSCNFSVEGLYGSHSCYVSSMSNHAVSINRKNELLEYIEKGVERINNWNTFLF